MTPQERKEPVSQVVAADAGYHSDSDSSTFDEVGHDDVRSLCSSSSESGSVRGGDSDDDEDVIDYALVKKTKAEIAALDNLKRVKAEIAHLESQKSVLAEQTKSSQMSIKVLRDVIATMESQKNALQTAAAQQMKTFTDERAARNAEHARLQAELETLKGTVQTGRAYRADLDRKIEAVKEQETKAQADLESTLAEVKKQTEAAEKEEWRVQAAKDEVAALQTVVADFEKRKKQIEIELEEVNDEMQFTWTAMESQAEKAKVQRATLQTIIANHEERKKQLEIEIEELNEEMESQAEIAKAERAKLDAQNMEAMGALQKTHIELLAETKAAEKAKEEAQAVREEVEAMKKELAACEEKKKEAEQAENDAWHEVAAARTEAKYQTDLARKAKAEAEKHNLIVEKCKAEEITMQTTMQKAREERSASIFEISAKKLALAKDIEDLTSQKAGLEAAVKLVESKMATLNGQVTDVLRKRQEEDDKAEMDKATLAKEIKSAQDEKAVILKQIKLAMQRIAELRASLDYGDGKKKQVQRDCDSLMSTKATLEEEIKLERARLVEECHLTKKAARSLQCVQEHAQIVKNNLDDLTAACDKAKDDRAKVEIEIADLGQKKKTLEEDIKAAEEKLEELVECTKTTADAKAGLEIDVETVEDRFEELLESTSVAEDYKAVLETDIKAAEKKLEELVESTKTKEDYKAVLEKDIKAAEEKLEELVESTKTKEDHKAVLEKDIKAAEEKLEELVESTKTKEDHKAVLEKDIQAAEDKKAALDALAAGVDVEMTQAQYDWDAAQEAKERAADVAREAKREEYVARELVKMVDDEIKEAQDTLDKHKAELSSFLKRKNTREMEEAAAAAAPKKDTSIPVKSYTTPVKPTASSSSKAAGSSSSSASSSSASSSSVQPPAFHYDLYGYYQPLFSYPNYAAPGGWPF